MRFLLDWQDLSASTVRFNSDSQGNLECEHSEIPIGLARGTSTARFTRHRNPKLKRDTRNHAVRQSTQNDINGSRPFGTHTTARAHKHPSSETRGSDTFQRNGTRNKARACECSISQQRTQHSGTNTKRDPTGNPDHKATPKRHRSF